MNEKKEHSSSSATTGHSYPSRKGSKRRDKDNANQWQKFMTGRGPAKTQKG